MALQQDSKIANVDHIEGRNPPTMEPTSGPTDPELEEKGFVGAEPALDDASTKKLIRKIDIRLIPALAFLYALALVDRGNLPNARLAGMDIDLGISVGNRYSILTMMFFIPYILCEFPANIAMRKIGPATWLGSIGFGWGVLTIGMGFCHTWGTLLVCRIIFGAFEAGLFPGAIYLMSCWYKRFEVQKRFSWFYIVGLLSNGLGSLIAYGLSQMEGLGGLRGWRWIFVIEGIASCVVAVVAFIVLIDFPDRATHPNLLTRQPFLSKEEAGVILARIANDRGDALPEKLTRKTLAKYASDWKIWEFGLLIGCNNTVVYSFAFFLPLILKGALGYSLEKTYVLLFPPAVLGAIWMLFTAWLGDKYQTRGPLIIMNSCISVIGMSMMTWLTNPTARYIGAFLGVAVTQSNIPAIFSYQHNNIVGQMKRALSTAILVGCGGCGGIVSANVFRQQDAPQYLPGMIVAIASQTLTILLVVKNFVVFKRANLRAARGEILIEGTEGFRYTY